MSHVLCFSTILNTIKNKTCWGLALASPAQAGTVAESDGPSEPIDSGHIEAAAAQDTAAVSGATY